MKAVLCTRHRAPGEAPLIRVSACRTGRISQASPIAWFFLVALSGCGHSSYPMRLDPSHLEDMPIQRLDCTPSEGFTYCVRVAAFIRAPLAEVYDAVAAFVDYDKFFPDVEFALVETGPPSVGSLYRLRERGASSWDVQRITALDKNALLAGVQVEGPFARFRFNHRFVEAPGGMISDETWEYVPPYCVMGRLANSAYIDRKLASILTRASSGLKRYFEARARCPSCRASTLGPTSPL